MIDLKFYSPEEELFYPPITDHLRLFIKRDDLIHPFVSGNKWRKLKYVVADARSKSKNHLVSFGGAYSNHLVALACAGAIFKFKTSAFVRGEQVKNHMLSLCEMWGMELYFVSRESYKNKIALYDENYGTSNHTYFIDEGGRGDLAAHGCSEILENCSGFTHVISAVGTGTTIAGIARAAIGKNMIAEGICSLKGASEMDKEIEMMAGYPVKIHHQFSRRGYGKSDDELMQYMKGFASETGILIDQVYTGKMMMAVNELIDQGYYPEGSKLLLVHTGGILGMLTEI